MSSSVTFISQTYFPQSGTSTFNYSSTRLCRKNLCGSGRTTEPHSSTRSSSCQSSMDDLHAPTLENTLFKSHSEPEK